MNPTGKKMKVQAVSDFCIKCQTNQYHMNDCDCKCHFESTKMKRICLRCGGDIEDLRTGNAKYCISCSSKDDRLSITGVMREINRLHNMFIKLQCNFWELEKCLKSTPVNNIQKKSTKKCLQKED